jgi:hypothetical protein
MDTSKLFTLGQVVATPAALSAIQQSGDDVHVLLLKHLCLDPGELDAEDVEANRRAVQTGNRILSSFKLSDGTKIWVITDAGESRFRPSTTVLLPSDY